MGSDTCYLTWMIYMGVPKRIFTVERVERRMSRGNEAKESGSECCSSFSPTFTTSSNLRVMAALAELNRPFPTSNTTLTPPRKRIHLEEDQDFFQSPSPPPALNDDDEDEQPPSDIEMYEQDEDAQRETELQMKELVDSTETDSTRSALNREGETGGGRESDRKRGIDAKGKGKMRFEEDDEFEQFGQEEFASTSTITKREPF